jgi:YHS domain-containing protein
MAVAGLATELLFGAAGLVPAVRPTEVVQPSFQWNYTTYLNILFIGVFAGLYWLYRNRLRLGGGARYAIDPVCGMQVERQLAPASTRHGDQTIFFCSDRCRDRFVANPDRYSAADLPTTMDQDEARRPDMSQQIDPICGMTVDSASAAAKREYAGKTFYFCSTGCAKAFDLKPEAFIDTTRSA